MPTWAGGLNNFVTKNVGVIDNKGIEFNLNIVPVKNDHLTWDVNFNFSKSNPKIISFSQYVDSSYEFATTSSNITGINNYIDIILWDMHLTLSTYFNRFMIVTGNRLKEYMWIETEMEKSMIQINIL